MAGTPRLVSYARPPGCAAAFTPPPACGLALRDGLGCCARAGCCVREWNRVDRKYAHRSIGDTFLHMWMFDFKRRASLRSDKINLNGSLILD
ncbi:unnamed protein product [Colias eurytheme]|nr:unnamed protein product [Colias eurytheme]